MDSWWERLKSYDRLLLGKILGVLILLTAAGTFYFFNDRNAAYTEAVPGEEFILEDPVPEDSVEIKVDIKGEVNYPGVYNATAEDRIEQLIEEAGGVTDKAVLNTVNFAQRVHDEMVIIIPSAEEAGENNAEAGSELSTAEKSKISINNAEQAEWETLSGIGPAKAAAIIQYREEIGSFSSIEELVEVPGIGEKTLEAIRDSLSLN